MFDLLEFLARLFTFMVGTGILVVAVPYVVDRNQTRHAVRRNFPVIDRFRYLLERLGREGSFAQYRPSPILALPYERSYEIPDGNDTIYGSSATIGGYTQAARFGILRALCVLPG